MQKESQSFECLRHVQAWASNDCMTQYVGRPCMREACTGLGKKQASHEVVYEEIKVKMKMEAPDGVLGSA